MILAQIPETQLVAQSHPEPSNARTFCQMPEPCVKSTESNDYQMPEPAETGLGEVVDDARLGVTFDEGLGVTIDSDFLDPNLQLWNLETYGDRHGKRRIRRTLRFISDPKLREELGQITPEAETELKSRIGKGRWQLSRTQAESLRHIANAIAESMRGSAKSRNKRKPARKGKPTGNPAPSRQDVPGSQDDPQWANLPDVLM